MSASRRIAVGTTAAGVAACAVCCAAPVAAAAAGVVFAPVAGVAAVTAMTITVAQRRRGGVLERSAVMSSVPIPSLGWRALLAALLVLSAAAVGARHALQ